MYKIAIIGSGILAKVFAERARELNIESHCFSFNSNDVACKYVDFFHEVNVFDVDTITEICKKNNVKGVIATTELTIFSAAAVAKNLDLHGNNLDVAKEITNKYLTRKKVAELDGLHQPKFLTYIQGDIPEIDFFPAIVKPIAAGGKRGVCVVNNRTELETAINEALPYSKVKGVMIEEFLAGGSEYSVESLSYEGKNYIIQVTEKDTSGPPRCNELGHHQPAKITREMRTHVEEVISRALTCAGIENGPCHTEIKIIDGKIYLIEINGRPGGDHITHPLVELSTGYPIVSGIIWASLGLLQDHLPQNLKAIPSGIFFVTEETAYLQELFDTCEQYPWLYEKHKINEGPSKIVFNDEEGLNYFIYHGEKPDINI